MDLFIKKPYDLLTKSTLNGIIMLYRMTLKTDWIVSSVKRMAYGGLKCLTVTV